MKKFLFGVVAVFFTMITVVVKIALPVLAVWGASWAIHEEFSWFPEVTPLPAFGGLVLIFLAGRFWYNEDPFGFRDEDDQE